jgi:Putative auto-transporter adhesin, head GIN domain
MKLLSLILSLSVFLLISCSDSASDDCEEGSGNYTEFSQVLGDYSSVHLAGAGNIYIIKGNHDTIRIVTDDNMVDNIEVDISNGQLTVKPKKDKCPTKMDCYVVVSEIGKMYIEGAGDIVLEEDFETDNCSFQIDGAGDIKLPGIITNQLNLMIDGSGTMNASGSAKNCVANLSGSGTIDLIDLVCENVTANLAGSGDIKVNSTMTMTAVISGSGDIYYKFTGDGTPQLTIAGSGNVYLVK